RHAAGGRRPRGRRVDAPRRRAEPPTRPPAQGGGGAPAAPSPPRPPLRQQVGGAPLHRDQNMGERAGLLGGRGLQYPPIGPSHPDAVPDRELDLPLPLDPLLDPLALPHLEHHPLLPSRPPPLPA